jgi:hypothetical protein
MSSRIDQAALELARLRRHNQLPIADARVADLEITAHANGRQLHVVNLAEDDTTVALVLGWHSVEPAASTRSPKLARRMLPQSAVKVLLVFYALIKDPSATRESVSLPLLACVLDRLAGPGAGRTAEKALSQVLTAAGLVVLTPSGWHPGPKMMIWDGPTKAVMDHAAERLWTHPLWSGGADA